MALVVEEDAVEVCVEQAEDCHSDSSCDGIGCFC